MDRLLSGALVTSGAVPIAFVLAAWILFALLFYGVGLLVGRLLHDPSPALSRTFWLGWAGTIGLLQIWCLLLPVDGRALTLMALVSIGGWSLAYRSGWTRLREPLRWLPPIALIAVWLADRALPAPRNGDTLLYHLSAVKWAEAFAALPGLGNLHTRLAFNNSSTLYQALVDRGPFPQLGVHLAHGLLVLPLFARGLPALVKLLRGQPSSTRAIVDAILLAAAVDLAMGPNLSSASPDLPAYVLEAVLASELAGWLESGMPDAALSGLALLSATLVSVKLSAAGFVAGVLIVVLFCTRRLSVQPILVASVVLVPWLIRGVILSGYPLFPSTLGGLPFDWRVPAGAATAEASYVRAWGRQPGAPMQQVLAGWSWIVPWLKTMFLLNREVVVPLGVGVMSGAVALVRHREKAPCPGDFQRKGLLPLLAIPIIAELLWWFFTSPDPRFAGASFWLIAAVGIAWAGHRLIGAGATALGLTALVLAAWPIAEAPSDAWIPSHEFGTIPQSIAQPFRTTSGLTISATQGCGDLLLCTPSPNAALRLRKEKDLAAGFMVSR